MQYKYLESAHLAHPSHLASRLYINMKYMLTLLLLVFSNFTLAGDLKPFTTDGCSSFPDGTLNHKTLWLKCCTAHDKAYWKGGTYQERIIADQALKQCVAQVGEPAIAQLMLAGVRVGGSPYFPTKFRWGYGWPYPRGYKALTAAEKKEVEALEKSSATTSDK